jgi:hypothetical protein
VNLRKDHYTFTAPPALFIHPPFAYVYPYSFLGGLARRQEPTKPLALYTKTSDNQPKLLQLSTMDLLVLASMKNAAKCDK